ncbi:hypothetical protein [Streptomyces rubiginosohelvolus]|uniref:hypothetical protein n=1 Tax=Streptomyces rubiginosohelvolus TaxID=67362 RepID=UPI003829A11F
MLPFDAEVAAADEEGGTLVGLVVGVPSVTPERALADAQVHGAAAHNDGPTP